MERSHQVASHDYVEHLKRSSGTIGETVRLLQNTPCRGPKMKANVDRTLELIDSLADSRDLAQTVKEIVAAAKVQGTEAAKAWDSDATYERVQDLLSKFRTAIKKAFDLFVGEPDDLVAAATVSHQFVRVAHCIVSMPMIARSAGWRGWISKTCSWRLAICCEKFRMCAMPCGSESNSCSSMSCRTPTPCRWTSSSSCAALD